MFVLAEMKDTVCIKPWKFSKDFNSVIDNELNKKLANKVVHNVGLCICLHSVTSVSDSYLFPGDGSATLQVTENEDLEKQLNTLHIGVLNVEALWREGGCYPFEYTSNHKNPLGTFTGSLQFRYVVFRPFTDEVLTGRIRSCNREGVQVSMEFFDDIFIPCEYLQQPSKFDDNEQLWVWEYQTDEGTHDLFMDINEEIRFRVIDETFVDLTPTGPESSSSEQQDKTESETKKSPYTISASISEPASGFCHGGHSHAF